MFKSRHFDRFARSAGVDDAASMVAAIEVRAAVFDVDLGGGVFKKRIARSGGGKSGGFRTVLVCTDPEFTLYVFGFAKKDRADLSPDQTHGFKRFAKELRDYPLRRACSAFVELEVSHGNQESRETHPEAHAGAGRRHGVDS